MNGSLVRSLSLAVLLTFGMVGGSARGAETPWDGVDRVFGVAGKDLPGGVHKYAWPRTDLHVAIGGVPLEPALALGSWGAFLRIGGEDRAMTMGDLVLEEKEVAPVVSALESNGLEVTAIHNHLLGETPHVLYLHFSGHGEPVTLAKGLRAALERTKTPLKPAVASGLTPAQEATLEKLEAALGRTGTMAGPVLQVGVPRAETITEDGMKIPPTMGMANGMNFEAVGDRVATTGDFVLLASEVNPVIRELIAHGIAVTALHSHMLTESPRLFFMHFWAVDTPEKVGEGLKAALARVHTK